MRYHAFITDYDGTLAAGDHVISAVTERLALLKKTGRKLILVTGRKLDELIEVFPLYAMFDRIVAENGALIYRPDSGDQRLLGQSPPQCLVDLLRARNIPLSIGKVIVATWEPHENEVLDAIRLSGLEYQVIFNKGAVMILPPGINKATGLASVLDELNISYHNAVAIGDAENDNAMLQMVECAFAVNNALPQVKNLADRVTEKDNGQGVIELIDRLLDNDLADLDNRLSRHYIDLGTFRSGDIFRLSPFGHNILIAGSSGSGKTTLATAFVEKLMVAGYQFCLIDPEGDYQDLENVMTIGDNCQVPLPEHVIKLLGMPDENAVICLLGVPLSERPAYFHKLLTGIAELQFQNGHPHFIILDEAHHLMPAGNAGDKLNLPGNLQNILAITTMPQHLNPAFLQQVDIAMTIGDEPLKTINEFIRISTPGANIMTTSEPERGEMLVWRKNDPALLHMKGNLPSHILMRHKRKYAAGDMGSDSFYFRGPDKKLNLRANNLMTFMQMASGVDDETWLYHLARHDYSAWFNGSVKDPDLAGIVRQTEDMPANPDFSRRQIFKAIVERYTLPG